MEPLLLIPGPSPVVPRILEVMAKPTLSHTSAGLAADVQQTLEILKACVFTASGEPFVFAGAGTLAMEVALLNVAAKDDRILVLSQGYFGDRMAAIAEAFGFGCDIIRSPWGSVVPAEELQKALEDRRYGVVTVTHVDTGTGAAAPLQEYSEVLQGREPIWIVDGVCATGGIEERMDDWGIDVVLSAAQKCFGAPPGLAIDVFSSRAMAKRRSLPSVPAYYSDILRWLPVMHDPQKYFSTHAVNEIRAFAEAARLLAADGIPARFRRQEQLARAVRAGLEVLGFRLFTEPECLAPTLSVVRYPEGIDDVAFRANYLAAGYAVAGGLGETAGRVFRMGHMGNLTTDQVLGAIEAMGETVRAMGLKTDVRAAVEAATAAFLG